MDALVSIHDVMPSTLDRVEHLLERCAHHGVDRITLLVVPGHDWSPAALDRLRGWQRSGHELAAHGWSHRAPRPRTLHHHLHAALISRDCAEHLSRPRGELVELMRTSHAWFADHGLAAPSLYVPPAWALGRVHARDLAHLPYGHVETLAGLRTPGGTRRLPLIGYEADSAGRAFGLRTVNALGRALRGRRPMRIALHPDDASLRLAGDLEADLRRVRQCRYYHELLTSTVAPASTAGDARTTSPGRRPLR